MSWRSEPDQDASLGGQTAVAAPAPAGRQLGANAVALWCVPILGVLLLIILVGSRVPLAAAAATALLLAVNVSACGLLWHRLVLSTRTDVEYVGVGIAGTFAVVSLMTVATPPGAPPWIEWSVAPVGALCVLALGPGRAAGATIGTRDLPSWVGGVLATGGALLLNRWQFGRYDVTAPIDFSVFHPDMVFFESVAQANGVFGSALNGVMADWPARYHWFSYAWAGSLDHATGAEPFTALTRGLPIVAIVGVAALASAWARRLTTVPWVPLLAAGLATMGHFVADSAGVVINWDSPSQTAATVVLLASCLAFVARDEARYAASIPIALGLLAFVLAGTKVSSAAVLVGAIWLAAGFLAVSRRPRWRADLLCATVVLGATAACWVVYLSGQQASGGLGLKVLTGNDPFGWVSSYGGALVTTLAVAPGWLGLAYLGSRRGWGPERALVLAVGLALAGLVPLWILEDERPNSIWFVTGVAAAVWVVSAVGAGEASRQSRVAGSWRIAGTSFLVALAVSLLWGSAVVRWGLGAGVVQLAYLALLGLAGLGVSGAIHKRWGMSLTAAAVAVVVIAGTMSPVTMLVAERFFAVPIFTGMPTPAVTTSDTVSDVDDGGDDTPVAIEEGALGSLSSALAANSEPGDQVAVLDDRLLPVALIARTRPFASKVSYATGLGPEDSDVEFARRVSLVDDALAATSPGARRALCAEGVEWVLGPSKAVPDPEIAGLPTIAVSGGATLWSLDCDGDGADA